MLRAQGLALAFEGDDTSGWAASIIQATAQAGAVDVRGHGVSQAAAAENVWKRHIAAPRHPFSAEPAAGT